MAAESKHADSTATRRLATKQIETINESSQPWPLPRRPKVSSECPGISMPIIWLILSSIARTMSGTSLDQSLAASPSPARVVPPDLVSAKEKLLVFDPLSAQDIDDIQPYLSRVEAEINKYSAEIDGLYRLLHLLAKERDELEGKKGELERIRAGVVWRCAPISRLVLDILTRSSALPATQMSTRCGTTSRPSYLSLRPIGSGGVSHSRDPCSGHQSDCVMSIAVQDEPTHF